MYIIYIYIAHSIKTATPQVRMLQYNDSRDLSFRGFHEILAAGDNNCDCCTSIANPDGDSGWGINIYQMRDVNAFFYYMRTCTESRQCLQRLFWT